VTTEHMLAHVKRLLEIPGEKLLFGGNQQLKTKLLTEHIELDKCVL
jgi:hypothetical protein